MPLQQRRRRGRGIGRGIAGLTGPMALPIPRSLHLAASTMPPTTAVAATTLTTTAAVAAATAVAAVAAVAVVPVFLRVTPVCH